MNKKIRSKTILTLALAAMAIGGLAATSANATWTPADLTNGAELWLDAADADTITKDAGNLVSQWDDKSGNDRHVSQDTSDKKPTYVATGFNGGTMPSLQFTEGSGGNAGNALGHSLSAGLPASEWALFAVVDDQSNDTEHMLFCAPTGVHPQEHRVWLHLNGVGIRSDSDNGGSSYATHVAGEQQLYYALSGTSSEVLRDGTQVAGNNGTYTDAGMGSLSVGARGATGHAGLNGDIAEFILLSYVPSTDDREMVDGYLAWKWGLEDALPGDHTYKSGAPLSDPNAPSVEAGANWITWSGQGVDPNASIVEKDPTDWTNLTYAWSADAPAGVIVEFDPVAADVIAPTVTITKDPGDEVTVTLTLEVRSEGKSFPVADTMMIDVYDDPCLAKDAAGQEVTFDPSDITADCITNLKDFAVLAMDWLSDYAITAPVAR